VEEDCHSGPGHIYQLEEEMDRWVDCIRQVLERAPTGALPLTTIAVELRREGAFIDPQDPWLLSKLIEDRETFRVIAVPAGPWADLFGKGSDESTSEDSWILLNHYPERSIGQRERVRARILEGFQAWAREMDGASPVSVARWIRANREGARFCTVLASA